MTGGRSTTKTGGRGRKRKATAAAGSPPTESRCDLGATDCDAACIVDWSRAKIDVDTRMKAGTMKLCEGHLAKLAAATPPILRGRHGGR